MKKNLIILLLIIAALFSSVVYARCQPVFSGTPGNDVTGGVPLIFGSIKLQPAEFMPTGLIGVTSVSLGEAQAFQSQQGPNTLLYQCDIADQGKTYEYFATNGDSNVGGYASNGDDIYQTFFPFIGIKLIRDDGKVFKKAWQHAPINGHIEGNKLNFYARDFSNVTAEIYRLPATLRGGTPRNYFGCSGPAPDDSTSLTYSCKQPNGYTVFVGPGWNDGQNITAEGANGNDQYGGWSSTNWFGFGMQYASANSFQQTSWGCRVYSYTNPVVLPAITLNELKAGASVGKNFEITYRCGGPLINAYINQHAGVGPDKISVAFRTDNIIPNGSVTPDWMAYLVSDNYGQDGYASNVGINVSVAGSVTPLGFITNAYSNNYNFGWFSPLDGEIRRQSNGASQVDITSQYFASYAVIDSAEKIKPGKIEATAWIVVRYW